MGCDGAEYQKNCLSNVTTGGGTDDGGGDALDDSGGATSDDGLDDSGGGVCDNWDPDAAIYWDRGQKEFVVDETLVDDIGTTPSLLWECDAARARIKSGGYYELYNIGRGDIATQLGLMNGDVMKSVNAYDLRWPDDYINAFGDLASKRSFTLVYERNGRTNTMKIEFE